MIIFIVSSNYAYDEEMHAFRTRQEAVEHIAQAFELVDWPHDTPDFWEMVDERYGGDNWKGLQFMKLDTMTMKMEDARP